MSKRPRYLDPKVLGQNYEVALINKINGKRAAREWAPDIIAAISDCLHPSASNFCLEFDCDDRVRHRCTVCAFKKRTVPSTTWVMDFDELKRLVAAEFHYHVFDGWDAELREPYRALFALMPRLCRDVASVVFGFLIGA